MWQVEPGRPSCSNRLPGLPTHPADSTTNVAAVESNGSVMCGGAKENFSTRVFDSDLRQARHTELFPSSKIAKLQDGALQRHRVVQCLLLTLFQESTLLLGLDLRFEGH